MPPGPKGEKRPADVIGNFAVGRTKEATLAGNSQEQRDRAAAAFYKKEHQRPSDTDEHDRVTL
jgi:hypothetical protein